MEVAGKERQSCEREWVADLLDGNLSFLHLLLLSILLDVLLLFAEDVLELRHDSLDCFVTCQSFDFLDLCHLFVL